MRIASLPPMGHLGIVVRDIYKSLEELRQVYNLPGLVPEKVYRFQPRVVRAWGKEVEGVELLLCLTEWFSGMAMEILQVVFGDIEHERFLCEVGGGVHHIQHSVREYDAYCEYMRERGGVAIFEAEIDDDRGYRRCTYFRFPVTNTVIEIAEQPRFRDVEGLLHFKQRQSLDRTGKGTLWKNT